MRRLSSSLGCRHFRVGFASGFVCDGGGEAFVAQGLLPATRLPAARGSRITALAVPLSMSGWTSNWETSTAKPAP